MEKQNIYSNCFAGKGFCSDVLTFKEKLCYGLGSGAEVIIANSILILAYPVYYLGLGVPSKWLGLILLGTKLFDAATDTVMGYFSDNSPFRGGRRKPFILIGAISTCIVSFLIWRPPEMQARGYAIYFLIMSTLFYAFYTVFHVPYHALGYEMTQNYDERTRLMTYKWGIGQAFGIGILPLLLPLSYKVDPGNAAIGARFWGPVSGVLFLILAIASAVVPKERAVRQEKISFSKALAITLKNKQFLLICAAIFLSLTGILVLLQLRQFLNMAYLYRMNQQMSAEMVKWFDYFYGAINMIFMFIVGQFAIRFEKKHVLLSGLALLAISSSLSFFYMTPDYPSRQLFLAILLAPGMSAVWVITNSCIADICDYDQMETGLRREGMYGAVFSFTMKCGAALGVSLGGFILWLVGFDKDILIQKESTVLALRLIFAFLPAILFGIACALFSQYSITRKSILIVQEKLEITRNTLSKECLISSSKP